MSTVSQEIQEIGSQEIMSQEIGSQEIMSQEVVTQEEQLKEIRSSDELTWDIESAKVGSRYHHRSATIKSGGWALVLQLAFQSLGVVYGDMGTSPLYVVSSIFSEGIKHNDDILGVFSLIFYTITVIPLIKYVLIVLRANDNGDGGTFALYSLVCRYAKVGLIPNEEVEDRKLESPNYLQSKLEKSSFAKYLLLFATMLGTSMVIGDGVFTPCISVLSAVGGIKESASFMTEDMIVWISVIVLIFLFLIQRFGTDKVGYSFAPIIFVWFTLIAGIGIYNLVKYDPSVLKALNPIYIIDYFQRNKEKAWISLGGVILCITGTEALFADVGHFSVTSIRMSMCTVTYPALVLAYAGQAAFLRKNNLLVKDVFYKSIPEPLYWPTFVVAVLAAIVASQAMISGTFSIIQQSLSLGCFPRVKIIHTSAKYQGQVYVPEINYLLMVACISVTLGFRTTEKIGNAYGIAVVLVMILTSVFLVLIMIMIWKTHTLLIISYILIIGTTEIVYLTSVLYKFKDGGYLPITIAIILMSIMYIWNNVYRKKYHYELDHMIYEEEVQEIVENSNPQRLPGLVIFYSKLVHGIPPIFKHYMANIPALHSVLIFVSFKHLQISKVPLEERFVFRRVRPKDLHIFTCVVRYGYKEVCDEPETFERLLIQRLKEFTRDDYYIGSDVTRKDEVDKENRFGEDVIRCDNENVSLETEEAITRDMEHLENARKAGVVHLLGENDVVAGKNSNICKRLLINHAYNFLKRNLRQTDKPLDIPHDRMLKVGMTYQL